MANERAATISKVAQLMRDLDFCMLTTSSEDGGLRARPMSNNGEVEFDGDVWFFSDANARKISEIETNPQVHLSYADPKRFRFISMGGEAAIINDKAKKKQLWLPELDRWFKNGPEADDVVLLKVTPRHVAYWNGEEQGELTVEA